MLFQTTVRNTNKLSKARVTTTLANDGLPQNCDHVLYFAYHNTVPTGVLLQQNTEHLSVID